MYLDDALLYNQGYMISINDLDSPLFYLFDYDSRSFKINMSFQHFHQFHEIHILLSGRASHLIEGDYYTLQPYDIVLLRPSLLHKTEYPAGGDCRRLIINFRVPDDSPVLHEMLQSCLQPFEAEVPIYRFTGETRAQAFSHLNAIFTLGKQPMTPLTQQFIHCHFLQFLATVAQHAGESSYEPQELSDSITQKVYAVTSYIHRHYASELSLEYLAEKFFISPYYLSHQFRRVTGFSLINYIQITRVRNAQQLLLYTDMKIADITTSCGFTSFSQFNRVFNKFCHTSPSQFRVNGVVIPSPPFPSRRNPPRGARRCNIFWCRPFPGQVPFFIFPASSVCRNCQNHCTASGRRLHTAFRPTGRAVRHRRDPQSGSGGPRHRHPAQPRAWQP